MPSGAQDSAGFTQKAARKDALALRATSSKHTLHQCDTPSTAARCSYTSSSLALPSNRHFGAPVTSYRSGVLRPQRRWWAQVTNPGPELRKGRGWAHLDSTVPAHPAKRAHVNSTQMSEAQGAPLTHCLSFLLSTTSQRIRTTTAVPLPAVC
ncbi:hypothetical protein DFH09DRAFT_1368595, partial [Mycena vulgaris]